MESTSQQINEQADRLTAAAKEIHELLRPFTPYERMCIQATLIGNSIANLSRADYEQYHIYFREQVDTFVNLLYAKRNGLNAN